MQMKKRMIAVLSEKDEFKETESADAILLERMSKTQFQIETVGKTGESTLVVEGVTIL